MKRSELKRGTSQLKRSAMKPSAKPMKARKAASNKPKRAARERTDKDLADLCHGQSCYLLMPGIACTGRDTVVPAHSNASVHGKGMGIKALHQYTVPACAACHAELDQGRRFTKTEKFALWEDAYCRWELVRQELRQIVSHHG